MRVLETICVFLSLLAVGSAWGGRSLGVGSKGRFAAMLKNRKGSLFGNRNRGTDSIFSRLASKVRKPVCHFDRDGVPQMTWPTKDKLCFDNSYTIPYDRLFAAIEKDPDAMETILLIQSAYINQLGNGTGYHGQVRYKDLCNDHGNLLERIWWTNTMSGQREVCYVIWPEAQGVYVPNGGGNCMMDQTVVRHHYCVPDGFVDRDIYVFCPGEFKQCRRTMITVPTGCSCKKYECHKYQTL